MTTVFHSGNQGDTGLPGTHVFIVGVGEYPCLLGGDPGRLLDKPMGLGQLSSPPLSAVAMADWFLRRQVFGAEVDDRVGFHNPHSPLASVEMLMSPYFSYKCPDGTIAAVDPATLNNIDACYGAWLERAKSHAGNIAVFYFCGHGAAGSSDYILPSDFGTHKKNPWSDAIDITETARAARREVSGSLYFFIDACRESSRDSLMPGANPPALQYVDFDKRVLCFARMLLWATGEGATAFGAKGQVSRFSAALIEALSEFYGEELEDRGGWAVTGEALAKSVRTILNASNVSLDGSLHQHAEAQLIGSQVLHYETREPKAVGRVVSTWSANPLVREMAQVGSDALAEGAQEALAEQLEQRNVQVDELGHEIEEWSRRYRELEQRLADEPDSKRAQQAISYLEAGKLDEAGAILDELIEAAESRLASVYLNRAEVFALQFQSKKALPFFRKAYECSDGDPILGSKYASELLKQNDFPTAESVCLTLLKAFRKKTKLVPELLPKKAMVLNNLGVLYSRTHRLDKAESSYKGALAIWSKLHSQNSSAYQRDVAQTLHNLAVIYVDTQRPKKAENTYRKALDIRRKLAASNLRSDVADVAQTLSALGVHYRVTRRWDKAENVYRDALGIRRRLARTKHPTCLYAVAATLNNLGVLYWDATRHTEAEAVYQEALNIRRKLAKLNPNAYLSDVAATLNNLGMTYRATGRPDYAETAYLEALGIRRKLAKENSLAYRPEVAKTLINVGVLYRNNRRFKEAEDAYLEALAIYRPLANANVWGYSSYLATTLYNLGVLYSDGHGRLREAETAYTEALVILRKLTEVNPSANQPDVALTLNGLGDIYKDTRRMNEAEATYREALDIYGKLAKDNPSTYEPRVTLTLENLAALHKESERPT